MGPLGRLGATDCEALGDGLFAQPVNTATSVAYVVGGVWLLTRARSSTGETRVAVVVFATVLSLVGVGSVAFHGPQMAGARWLHDLPIIVLGLVMLAWDLRITGRLSASAAQAVVVVGAVVVGAVLIPVPDAGLWIGGVLVVAVVGTEFTVRHRRPARLMVALLALGVVANALGRTDAPLCEPESWIQMHGLWHLITATVFVIWGEANLRRDGV